VSRQFDKREVFKFDLTKLSDSTERYNPSVLCSDEYFFLSDGLGDLWICAKGEDILIVRYICSIII